MRLTNIVNVTQVYNALLVGFCRSIIIKMPAAGRSNTELMIYSRDAGQCVKIAYRPVQSPEASESYQVESQHT